MRPTGDVRRSLGVREERLLHDSLVAGTTPGIVVSAPASCHTAHPSVSKAGGGYLQRSPDSQDGT
jgi:hypothetical protein